jgi:hypothetical protein
MAMRIVPRESIPEAKLLRLAGNQRPVEVDAVIDVNGRVKVNRVIDADGPAGFLAKPTARFAIFGESKGDLPRPHS